MLANLPDLPIAEDKLQIIAHSVNGQLQKSVDAFIEAGLMLLKAKSEVSHGQFERLFQDHPNPIKEPLRFTSRHGQKLMAIAEHAVLSKPEHRSLLPHAITTLSALAQLPASTVQKALTSGLIKPGMQERDVRNVRLLGDPKAGPPTTKATDTDKKRDSDRVRAEAEKAVDVALVCLTRLAKTRHPLHTREFRRLVRSVGQLQKALAAAQRRAVGGAKKTTGTRRRTG